MPNLDFDAKVISLPYDFSSIYDAPGADKSFAPLPAPGGTPQNILGAFGYFNPGWYSPVPAVESFALDSYPNPFNPSTKIAFTMPGPATSA